MGARSVFEMAPSGAIALALMVGCHSTSTVHETTLGKRTWVPQLDTATTLKPRASITPKGQLLFAHPLQCMGDVLVVETTDRVVKTGPNLATLVVGIIATSAGVVFSAAGLSGDDPSGSPATYVGVAGLAVGIPLIVGPLWGNTKERHPVGTKTVARGNRRGHCGSKPVPDGPAVVHYLGLEIPGNIDSDGVFSVSPFTFTDAYLLHQMKVLDLIILGRLDKRNFQTQISASELAARRDSFFAAQKIAGAIKPLHKVPRLEVESFVVHATKHPPYRAQIDVTIANNGPGDAWGVRGVLSSRDRQLDDRVIYFGHVPPKATQTRQLKVPMNRRVQAGSGLAITIRDAHNTAPTNPTRAQGK